MIKRYSGPMYSGPPPPHPPSLLPESDLRKGNIVLLNGQQHTVTQIIPDCHGIPLDETWLLKFGFKKVMKGHYNLERIAYMGDFYLPSNFFTGRSTIHQHTLYFVHVYYVHQMQNLLYCLTGNEYL